MCTISIEDSQAGCILQSLSEVKECDPRLMIILGFARMHAAIGELVDMHAARQTNGRKPNQFKTQISALRRVGILDARYYEFLRMISRVRNGISHRVTDANSLAGEPYLSDLMRLHELASVVPVWPKSISPIEDLGRSVFAFTTAGCLAIELDFGGEPKGFKTLLRMVGNAL